MSANRFMLGIVTFTYLYTCVLKRLLGILYLRISFCIVKKWSNARKKEAQTAYEVRPSW